MKTEEKIYNFIKSNQLHSTLIGKMISVSNSDSAKENAEIMEFSEWMATFMKKVDKFAKTSKDAQS